MDLVYLFVLMVLTAATLGFLLLCERLRERRP